MHPLNVYGYHVRYGHSKYKQNNYTISESVCFAPLFSCRCDSKYYRIYILKGDADLKKYYSNYCFFNKKEIINHLKQIPKFCYTKFSVIETTYKGNDAFQIDMYIDSDERIIHKYILTWIRSVFEWPFYLYLLHARELHKMPEFKFESIVNLFNVVATVHRKSFDTNIHTFGVDLLPIKKKEIINRIDKVNQVNSVFPKKIYDDIPQRELPSDFDEITQELFEKNCPAYIEAYHIIKNHENNSNRK